jgi:hypothetical protein
MITIIKSQLFLLAFFVLATSCNQNTSSENRLESFQYELVIVDSLMIESLEELQITDYSPAKNRFLAFGVNTKTCLEIDREGNIISTVDLRGEGPGHFGRGLTELGYFGDQIIINGASQYFIYDGEWNYQDRILYEAAGYYLPVRYISGAPKTLLHRGKAKLIKPVDKSEGGFLQIEEDYFSKTKMIGLYEKGKEGISEHLSYPENAIYRNSDQYYSSHQPLVSYNAENDILAVVMPLQNRVFEYTTNDTTFSLVNTYDLELQSFRSPQGIPYEDQHKNGLKGFGLQNELNYVYNMANSQILNIDYTGGVLMIAYKTGANSATQLSSYTEALALAKKESKTITAFFIKGERVFETEESFDRSVRISESQFIAPFINEEVESDYSKCYIYELKKEKR